MRLGIIGYGQLARMLYHAGLPLGVDISFLSLSNVEHMFCPEKNIYTLDRIKHFIQENDAISFETENIPWAVLDSLREHSKVYPNINTIKICQDRYLEKSLLADLGIKTAKFTLIRDLTDIDTMDDSLVFPCLLKTAKGGYDGNGQHIINNTKALQWHVKHAPIGQHFILEEIINFENEISIIGVRDKAGRMVFYPITQNLHCHGILQTTRPVQLSQNTINTAKSYLEKICNHFNYVGVIALELFNSEHGLIANEIAPRVHNSGHWTIEGTNCSQFESHIRAISSMPLKEIHATQSIMVNIIGKVPDLYEAMSIPEVHVHLYHKKERENRKLGHITATANLNSNIDFLSNLCEACKQD